MSTINPQDITPEAIAGLLSCAAEQLDDDTVATLRQARNFALKRQAQPFLVLNTGHGIHLPVPHTPHQWIAVIAVTLLIAMLAGSISYRHHAHEHEMSHLDIAILTDDLPMEIFIDR
ncbi:MAG TPA: DUF3619 family protein [Gallionella sp.]|nr:DUF3619 family protein [Gallionella sp.]